MVAAGTDLDVPGPTKASLVMLLLGEEYAGEIFKQLSINEVKKLNSGMAGVSALDHDTQQSVLEEFHNLLDQGDPFKLSNAGEYLKALVQGNMEPDQARRLLEELSAEDAMKLNALEPVDARTLANLIRKEHPQTIALIMAYTASAKAAAVLAQLPVDTQVEVCLRMASLDAVTPATLRDVESALLSEMKGMVLTGGDETSGVVLVAEILNSIEKAHEERIFEQLNDIDPELAEEIRKNMFVFDDLIRLDDRGIQALLKEVEQATLILALKTANEEIKDKIWRNLSSRAVEMMKEDMEIMGPTKLSDVESAQTMITQTALRMEAEGKIVIASGGDDLFV